jgi:long-chain acyl-CoA synthetase
MTIDQAQPLGSGNAWDRFYTDAARNFDPSALAAEHMAEVVGLAAREYGGKPAVSTQLPSGHCATLDFNDIDRLTDDFAVFLREVAGLRQGDVVALMSPNCIDFVLAAFGVFKAGCICTNLNPMYTAPEVEHQLVDSGATALVIVDLFGDKADAAVGSSAVKTVVKVSLLDFLPPIKRAVLGFVLAKVKKQVPGMATPHLTMADALKQGARLRARGAIDIDGYRAGQSLDDTAIYQYTGGTTGRSKGAELTHRNILTNAAVATSMIDDGEGGADMDCTLVALPLYHITAFALIMLPGLIRGAHSVMVPSPRPASNLKAAFEKHPISHFTGINTLYAALLNEPWCNAEVLQHLKFCSSGGAAQQVDIARRWEELSGVPVLQGYGLTECAGVLTMNPIGANRAGSAGIPVPGARVKIVDDEGAELPAGEPGEVVAQGPTIMKGYLNRPEATAETIKDGWLFTGDIGVMDPDGYVQIVDRKKDMILVSGFNVYPNEIEEVIIELPGVVEVGVIGVPDEKTGEAVKAYIVPSDPGLTAEQVTAHCHTSLTNYKRPRHIEFVKEIPKSPVGKVLRRSLRDLGGT